MDSLLPEEWNEGHIRFDRDRSAAVVGLVLVANTQASPVRHDNLPGPGHYDWGDTVGGPNWELAIPLPAALQGGPQGLSGSFYHTNIDPSDVGASASDGRIHVGGDFGVFLVGLNLGESIPAAYAWDASGFVLFEGFGSALPEGQQTYLGLSFDLGDGDRYGWIGVVRDGHQLDAFAWGYETEPGVAIAAGVPEPGTLALLAFGAAGLAFRRRRQHA